MRRKPTRRSGKSVQCVERNSRKEVYLRQNFYEVLRFYWVERANNWGEGGKLRFDPCEAFGSGDRGSGEGVSLLEGSGDVATIYWRLCGQYGLNHARDMRTSGVVA